MDILEIKNVAYSYANSKEKVLSGVNQKFELGKFYAIVGKSGTGKSTLLSLLAGLDKPQTGKILFKNEDIQKKGYSNHRKNNISLVFQNYNLIDYLSPIENIRLKGVNGQIKSTQQQLKDVDKLLKLDPGNTELLACIAQVKAKNGIIERENYEDTRISNNLNQYARKANETGKLYEEDIAEIKKMNNEQTELLKKVLEAVIHLYEDDSKKRK